MLDTLALGILCFSVIVVFYGIIVIHDIPYEIAKHRNHPHLDAIHVAGWVSLLTLHVLWPFLWIWSTLYREDRGWGFSNKKAEENPLSILENQLAELTTRIDELELAAAEATTQIEILSEAEIPVMNPLEDVQKETELLIEPELESNDKENK
ncbi:MAG: DUF3302 domain-containing protein [Methylophaga sp.]|nr:DUF3302 domain-containing protein [Methylophaga sp.]